MNDDSISRQAAIKEIARWKGYLDDDMICRIQVGLNRLPPVQPEIIRCKDCKYYIPYEWMFHDSRSSSNINDYSEDEIGCSLNECTYPPDGFCSNAERKDNG